MNRKKLLVVLLLALVSGGLASYLSLARSGPSALVPSASTPTSSIIVAARALPPGAMIQAADVRQIPWASATPPSGTLTRVEDAVGRVVRVPFSADEPILASLLARQGSESGLSGLIPAGKRAVSVPVDEVVGINGFVGPGARVDVIATFEVASGNGDAIARAVLQDVEVLASGHDLQADPSGAPKPISVATLLVTPGQAEALVLALHKGRIQLVLRSSADRAAVATPGMRTSVLTGSASPGSVPAATTARPPRAATRVESRRPRIVIMAADGSGKSIVRY